MRIVVHIAVWGVALALGAVPAFADFAAGQAAQQRRDYATALKEWQEAADRGDARAEHGLGQLYLNGLGVRADSRAAAEWFRRAAERGLAEAQFSLGELLRQGTGLRRDPRQAGLWYLKAAQQGDAAARFALAFMFEQGQGVDQNDAKALAWYRLAIEAGHPLAIDRLNRLSLNTSNARTEEAQRYTLDSLVEAGL